MWWPHQPIDGCSDLWKCLQHKVHKVDRSGLLHKTLSHGHSSGTIRCCRNPQGISKSVLPLRERGRRFEKINHRINWRELSLCKESAIHGVPQGFCQEPRGSPHRKVRKDLRVRHSVIQIGPGGAHRGGPTNQPVLPMGGGRDPVRRVLEDAVQPCTESPNVISCHQQDRDVLPGAQGLAQKKTGIPDLEYIQAIICQGIPRPGIRNQGHKLG